MAHLGLRSAAGAYVIDFHETHFNRVSPANLLIPPVERPGTDLD